MVRRHKESQRLKKESLKLTDDEAKRVLMLRMSHINSDIEEREIRIKELSAEIISQQKSIDASRINLNNLEDALGRLREYSPDKPNEITWDKIRMHYEIVASPNGSPRLLKIRD